MERDQIQRMRYTEEQIVRILGEAEGGVTVEGLTRKKRKQVVRALRRPKVVPSRRRESWSMDFMPDAFTDGRAFRVFKLSTT